MIDAYLNQKFEIYKYALTDGYGQRKVSKNPEGCYPCRFSAGTAIKYNEKGEKIKLDGFLHLSPSICITIGDYIKIEDSFFEVMSIEKTPDLNGNYILQYLTLTRNPIIFNE